MLLTLEIFVLIATMEAFVIYSLGKKFSDAKVQERESYKAYVSERERAREWLTRVRELEAAAEALPSGPYRSPPAELPEPVQEGPQLLYPNSKLLACPLCGTDNKSNPFTNSYKGCAGCDVVSGAHLHVTCWSCGFKFAMRKVGDPEAPALPQPGPGRERL